jgi:hypothetical protein
MKAAFLNKINYSIVSARINSANDYLFVEKRSTMHPCLRPLETQPQWRDSEGREGPSHISSVNKRSR